MKQVQVKLLLCFLLATCITGQYAGQPFGGQQPVLGQSSISAWGGLQGPGTFLPHLASKSLLGAKTIGEPLAAETTASYAEPAAPQIPVSIARPAAIREFSATYGQPAAVPQAPRTALHCHTEPDLPQVAVPVQTTILKSADSSYGSSSSANAQALTNIIRSTGSSYESNGNFAAPTMNTLVKSAGSSYGNTENFAVPAINTMAKASASAYGSANNFVASAPVHTFKSTGSSYGSNNIVAPATATLIRTTGSGYGSNGHFATPTMNTIVKSAGSSYGNTENFAVPTINTMAKASASAYGSAGGFVAPATATLIRSTGSAYGGTENFATPIVPSFIGASKSSLIATPTGQPYGIRSTGEYVAYSEEPVDISRCGAVPAENPCSTYGAQYFALSSTPECYIQCAFERAFIRPCPIGLIWNPLISVCDWPTPAPVPAPASDVSYGSGSYGANVALSTPSYSASAVAASAPSYSYGRKKRSIERKKRGMGGMGGMGGLLGGMGGMGGLLGGMGGMGGLLGGFGKPVVSEVPLGPPIPGLLPLPGFPGPIGIPGPLIPPPIFPPFLPPIVPPIGPIPPPILPPPLLPPLGPMIPPLGPMVPPLLPPMVPPLLPPMVPPFLPPLFPPLPIPLPGPLLPPLPMSLPATFIPGPPPIFGAPFLPPFGGPFGPLGGPLGGFGGLGSLGGLGFPSGPDSFFEEPFGDDFGFGGGFPFGDDFYGGARGGYDSYDGYGDKGGYGKNKGYDSYDGYGNKGGYGKNKGYDSYDGYGDKGGYGKNKGYDSYDGYGDKGGYGKSKGYPKRNNYKSNGNFSPKSKGYGGGYGKGYDDDYSSYDDSYSSSYGKNDYDYRRKREYGLNVEQQQQPRAMLSQPIPLNLNQLPSLSSGLISQQPSVVSSYSYAPKTPIVEMPVVPKLVKPSLCIGKPNNTNLPYPNDPTKYISCLNEETFEIMDCPKDLIYNSERDQCEKVKNTEKICERDQPCLNDGQCHQTSPSTYKCTCRGAWTGEHCETPLSSCATNPCGEGNECHTLNANDYKQDYVCVCSGKKSYGLSCDRNTVQNPCIAAPDDHEQYYPFAFSAHAYVQCNGDLLYVRPCAAGLFWNQEEKICDREPTAPLRSFDQPQSYQVETTTKAIPSTSYSSFEKPIDRQQGGRYRTYNPEPAVPTQRELFPQINSRVHLPSTPTYGSSSQDRHIPMTHDFSSKHLQTSMFRPLGQSNLLRTAPFKSTWSLPRMNTQLKTSAYRR